MNTQSIIVKLKYDNDFRRATLSLAKINTYDAMAGWIAVTYNLQDGAENMLLKYKDEDDDLITMINDDDLQHAVTTQQKLFIHVFIADDKIALNNSSRLTSPIKSDLAAVIHPSSPNEERQEFAVAASPSSSKNEMSPPQQPPSYPGKSETPINFSSSNGILQHQSPSSQSRSAIREHCDSTTMNGMPPQQQQQHIHPSSYPYQSANGQQYAPPLMNGLPSQQHQQPHHQLQQRPSYNSLPPPPSSQQQHHQQQPQQNMPSYPPQSGTSQNIAPPSMNGLPPLSIQQQPPSYLSQPTTQQSYAPPPSMNGLQPQNGLAPPSSLQQQQHRQGQPQMSYPPVSAPPIHYGPPPTSTFPGNGNPFSRQQFQQRPSQL